MSTRKSSKRRDAVPPWHPKILIPSILFGMPLAWSIRYVSAHATKEWREFPAKFPHLVLKWIQEVVQWTADTFEIHTLCIAWVALVALVYLLPSATRPDMEERQLASELAELEKEVAELAEDLQEFVPEYTPKAPSSGSKKDR